MADIGVFPTLPGLAWSVTKAPTFQTRIQRAVSGRELRALDYPYPLWQFTILFNFLRDQWDTRGGTGLGAGFDELRTLLGFYMSCQGAYGSFLFDDPTDDAVVGQTLPLASSAVASTSGFGSPGSGYAVGDIVGLAGGTASAEALWRVNATGGGGSLVGLTVLNPGSYSIIPGANPIALNTSGSGSGGTLNVVWVTTTQLVRSMGVLGPGGGFVEPILAPNNVSTVYYAGVPEAGVAVNAANGILTLPAPFTSAQPVITADFTYYFRCRFVDDSYTFENFMYRLWQLKKLTFISVRP